MINYDIIRHVKGESQFVDDLIVPEGTLYASVCYSKIAHGDLISIDSSDLPTHEKCCFNLEEYEGVFLKLFSIDNRIPERW